jgi:hypothetical protein
LTREFTARQSRRSAKIKNEHNVSQRERNDEEQPNLHPSYSYEEVGGDYDEPSRFSLEEEGKDEFQDDAQSMQSNDGSSHLIEPNTEDEDEDQQICINCSLSRGWSDMLLCD